MPACCCMWFRYTMCVMGWEERLDGCEGFDWDAGNADKIWARHRVTPGECEEVFSSEPLVVGNDEVHSGHEERYYALGKTASGRLLFLAFTVRGHLIRVISARDMKSKGTENIPAMKKLPEFRSESQEREFWATHDSTGYLDWRKASKVVLPKLRPSSQVISLRLPKPMLERLKQLANKRDVPYQSLLKIFLAERIDAELHARR